MKNIYIVDEHQSSKQNGVGTYIIQLLKCFEGKEYNVNLLSFNSDEKELKIYKKKYYNEYCIPICGKDGFLKNGGLTLSVLRLYIDDSLENVFFINHSPCLAFLKNISKLFPLSRIIFVIHDQGWCAPLLGDKNKLKQILCKHSFPKNEKEKIKFIRKYVAEERKMYQVADDIVTLAKATNDLLIDIYEVPNEKIHLIPNGMDFSKNYNNDCQSVDMREKLGISDKEFVILYAGRTVESKGIVSLLAAFEQLYMTYPHVRLVIAGQVFNLNEFTRITPLSNSHITYTGLISHEQLSGWYQIADVGILPSYTEQCSYFGIELLAQANLIIATDGHNMTDMFDESVSIISHVSKDLSIFQNELHNALTEAIQMSLQDKEILRSEARKRAKERYSLKTMKQLYLNLVDTTQKNHEKSKYTSCRIQC